MPKHIETRIKLIVDLANLVSSLSAKNYNSEVLFLIDEILNGA